MAETVSLKEVMANPKQFINIESVLPDDQVKAAMEAAQKKSSPSKKSSPKKKSPKSKKKKKEKRSQIFVTNLNPSMDESYMRTKFSEFGEVLHYFKPPISQRDKGCCILTFSSLESSEKAKAKYNGKKLEDDGYEVHVMIQERFIEPEMLERTAAGGKKVEKNETQEKDDVIAQAEKAAQDALDGKEIPFTKLQEEKKRKEAEEDKKKLEEAKLLPTTGESGSQIFIANVASEMTEEFIKEKFGQFGKVLHYFTPPINHSGIRKCCILTFESKEVSEKAKEKYHGKPLEEDKDQKQTLNITVQEKFIAPLTLVKMGQDTKKKNEKKNIEKLAMQSAIDDLENSECPRARKAAKILKAKSLGLDPRALAQLLRDDIGIIPPEEEKKKGLDDIAEGEEEKENEEKVDEGKEPKSEGEPKEESKKVDEEQKSEGESEEKSEKVEVETVED